MGALISYGLTTITRPIRFLSIVVLLLVAACGDNSRLSTPAESLTTSTPAADGQQLEPMVVQLGTGEALVWGSGAYGVVLVHGAIYDAASWTAQAETIAAEGFSVVAIENATADDVAAATDYLVREHQIDGVALVGASAGTSPVLNVASSDPGRIDQIIILAGSGDVTNLGTMPKLFIAAENDGSALERARQMAAEAPGSNNQALIVSGSAHAQALFQTPQGDEVLQAIVDRLIAAKDR